MTQNAGKHDFPIYYSKSMSLMKRTKLELRHLFKAIQIINVCLRLTSIKKLTLICCNMHSRIIILLLKNLISVKKKRYEWKQLISQFLKDHCHIYTGLIMRSQNTIWVLCIKLNNCLCKLSLLNSNLQLLELKSQKYSIVAVFTL